MRAIFRLMSDDVSSAFTLSRLQGSEGESPDRNIYEIQILCKCWIITSAGPEVLHFTPRFIEINAQFRHWNPSCCQNQYFEKYFHFHLFVHSLVAIIIIIKNQLSTVSSQFCFVYNSNKFPSFVETCNKTGRETDWKLPGDW